MEIGKKKIVIMSLTDVACTASGKMQAEDVTDFRLRRDVLDYVSELKGVSRLFLVTDEDITEKMAQIKAIELFIFIYCKSRIAVRVIGTTDGLMALLPHNLRKKELFLSVDEQTAKDMDIDYLPLNKISCLQ